MKLFAFFLIALFPYTLTAQEHSMGEEINASVKELSAFHKVIYPIWHKAYPSNDFDMLRKLKPEVNEGAEKIYTAKLPGILRDKEKKWNETVAGFRQAVERYNEAADGENNEALLTAAEVLHTYYELLVRCIKPVVPELDNFHKSLYVVYHSYFPKKNYTRIKESVDDLIIKATKVKDSKLPERLRSLKKDYENACSSLYHSTLALKEALYSNNSVLIDNAVEKMHSDYQRIEKIFE